MLLKAQEEILIAEGSDWNWWYGPEHHSANDREFDELYRKHLSNVYQALGRTPPDYLAQPIAGIMYELDAIAACVIGGTSLSGGQVTAGPIWIVLEGKKNAA